MLPLVTSLHELPVPACTHGFASYQLKDSMSTQQYKRLMEWMSGQTMMICDGRRYNHATREYEPSECGGRHGVVIYVHDVDRFLHAQPVVD
jgi:hypothetical protein